MSGSSSAIVTVIHDYSTFPHWESTIGSSCSILFMFHQKPFLLIHQNIILSKPCFLSFLRFYPVVSMESLVLEELFLAWKFWNDNESISINIKGCGFPHRDYRTSLHPMEWPLKVLRSLFLRAYFYIRRSFPGWILPIYTCWWFSMLTCSFLPSQLFIRTKRTSRYSGVSFTDILHTDLSSFSSSSSNSFYNLPDRKKNLIAFITHTRTAFL